MASSEPTILQVRADEVMLGDKIYVSTGIGWHVVRDRQPAPTGGIAVWFGDPACHPWPTYLLCHWPVIVRLPRPASAVEQEGQ